MKSVAFLLPLDIDGHPVENSVHDKFRTSLKDICGGYTERVGRRYKRDPEGKMFEEQVTIYEVAFASLNLDEIGDVARPLAQQLNTEIETKIDGDTIVFGGHGPISVEELAPAAVSDWPTAFDIAIQTVIGPELHAIQDYFNIDPKVDVRSHDGTFYYRGAVSQESGNISVVVCCQGSAGNDAAAVIAERLINFWKPKAIFLMGICAGRRGKCQIGDVVTPRVIVDDTEGVAEATKRLKRPKIYTPPHAMIQQLQNFRLDEAKGEWHEKLLSKRKPPIAPAGKEDDYNEHVARVPSHHEAGIYSSGLLLRDPGILEQQSEETHQQIRIGEMEAAGFGTACNARGTPVPWFVVRGVSDFGDEFKNDAFHKWASHTAASYLHVLIKHGVNVSLL